VSVSPGPLFLDVVVLGEAPAPVLRSGARVGDDLWVTGTLGAAAAAVEAWRRGQEPPADARAAFARPRPRIREALWLNERGVLHAMLDLSDGLAGDAGHLAAASGVGVVLEPGRVPVAAAARAVAAPGGTAGPGPASAGAQSAAATGTRPPGAARPSSKAGASPTGAQPAAARTGPSAAAGTGAPAATSPTGVKAPGAPAATDDPALVLALTGGEDYELCFAAGPGAVESLVDAFAREFGVPLTRVGRIVEGAGVAVQEADGSVRPLSLSGYRHFEEVRGVE
jgi:thiamine monophosphate kinase